MTKLEQTVLKKALRNEIIQRIQFGLSPEEGQKQADEAGLGNLLPSVDAEIYHPLRQPKWTILMAWAWVSFRDFNQVRVQHNPYRINTYRWKALPSPFENTGVAGHIIVPNKPRFLHEIQSSPWDDDFEVWEGASYHRALQELRLAILDNKVATFGRDIRNGANADMLPISADNWHSLQLGPEIKPDGTPGGDMLYLGGLPTYVEILLSSADLIFVFPPLVKTENSSLDIAPPTETTSSGVPGRPTSRHLFQAEFDRRAAADQVLPSLAAEARFLSEWLSRTHPKAHSAGQGAIKNALRDAYNDLKLRPAERPGGPSKTPV